MTWEARSRIIGGWRRDLGCAALMAIALAQHGPATAQDAPVTLRVQWSMDVNTPNPSPTIAAYKAAHEKFLAEHPNVTVETEVVPALELFKQFLVADEGGNPPDITYQGAANTYTLASAGRILPLNQYTDTDPHLNAENMSSAILDTETIDGKIYGIPTTTDVRLLYWRRDLFAEAGLPDTPPVTRDDLIADAKALTKDKDGNGSTDQWGFCFVADNSLHTPHMWLVQMFGGGGELLDKDGRAIYNNPAGVAAAQFYSDLVNTYKVSPPQVLSMDYDSALRSLVSGQCAMAVLGSWSWIIDLKGPLGDKIGWARVPHPADGRDATFSGGWSWMISAHTQHPDVAWAYIKAMTSPEVDAKLAQYNIPTRKSALATMDPDGFLTQTAIYAAEAKHGNPQVVHTQALFDGIGKAVQAVIQKRGSAKEELDRAAAEYNSRYAGAQ